MRFMVMVKATKDSEAGVMPNEKLLADMGKFNEEMVKAGVMLAGEGLHPSPKGARVRFSGAQRTVVDGPFAQTKELIAGFWMIQVKSKQEAIDWIKRCPNPFPGVDSEIEIRQVFEAEDFGAEFTPSCASRRRACARRSRRRNEMLPPDTDDRVIRARRHIRQVGSPPWRQMRGMGCSSGAVTTSTAASPAASVSTE